MRAAGSCDARQRRERGFSLVEMLVVVVVLGVLAAISVPLYLGLQDAAKDASVQVDLANAKKSLVAFGADHEGALPTTVARSGAGTYGTESVDLVRYGWTVGSSTRNLAFTRVAGGWCVLGTSATGAAFVVTASGAVGKGSSCSN